MTKEFLSSSPTPIIPKSKYELDKIAGHHNNLSRTEVFNSNKLNQIIPYNMHEMNIFKLFQIFLSGFFGEFITNQRLRCD